ncbi:hypothetical protein ED235_11535 [Enterococcus faecalis]|nr:hypothetical protein [Enterococcus faecalis]EGO8689573.1 hypothetical protein [Enterococcus faecalis]
MCTLKSSKKNEADIKGLSSENQVGTVRHSQRLNCDECSHEKANKKEFPKIVIKHNEERVDVAS